MISLLHQVFFENCTIPGTLYYLVRFWIGTIPGMIELSETVLSGDTLYLFFYSIHFHIRLETQFAINFEYALQRSCILIRKTNDYETKRCPWTKAHTTLHPLCFRTNWIYSFWISILIVFLLSFYPWCARFIFQGQILKRNIFPLGKGRKVEVS